MNIFQFSISSQNVPILAYEFGNKEPLLLILSLVHGDETEGFIATNSLINDFIKDYSFKQKIIIVPYFNIDGFINKTRGNANNVDLNRNLPTNDWSKNFIKKKYYPGLSPASEIENQKLIEFINNRNIKMILSLHSWNPLINVNGNCFKEAKILAEHTKYEIKEDIGYPTPGSLGTFCGLERNIPTITYEMQRGALPSEIINIHVTAIKKLIKFMD